MSIYTCISAYPILDGILTTLSASDASSFLCALNIRLSEEVRAKYLNILRDIPEHSEWINDMIKAGNKVMLIGSDLERLIERLRNPDTYDRKNEVPLCLWLAVIPTDIILHDVNLSDYTHRHLLSWRGEFKKLIEIKELTETGLFHDFADLFGPLDDGYLSSVFICRFKYMSKLPTSNEGSDWFISTLPNENNIRIVYFASYCDTISRLSAYLRPCLQSNKDAILCYKEITGNTPKNTKTWNIPLLSYDNTTDRLASLPYCHLNTYSIGKSNPVILVSYSNEFNIKLHSDIPRIRIRESTQSFVISTDIN